MNETHFPEGARPPASREETFAALFANMVVQHSNMALMCLGKVPHPDSGELVEDLESARMLIDQLEMLESKTKGNLDKREEALLKKALGAVRMAFVETVEGTDAPVEPGAAPTPAFARADNAAPVQRIEHASPARRAAKPTRHFRPRRAS